MHIHYSNNKKNITGWVLAILLISCVSTATAQPYLDILNLKYLNSPDAGLFNQNKNAVKIEYISFGTNIPIKLKNKKDAVILSPFWENWILKTNNQNRESYHSITLPVSLSKSIPYTRWSYLLKAIVRINDSIINSKGQWQIGGAIICSYKKNEKLTLKLGVYINNEFFGVFVMPLVGLDWKIDARNNLFGVLPGNLTYEHKINKRFYYGANFRAITNSYAKSNGYLRVNENQLGLYLDTYLNKNFVLNIEAGHSFYRKLESGVKHVSKLNAKVNDNLYVRATLAYRIRF